MSSSNDHSRCRLADGFIRRASEPKAVLASAMIMLALAGLCVWQTRHHATVSAQVHAPAAASKPIATNASLQMIAYTPAPAKGVDLLAYVGINGTKQNLYELSGFDRGIYKQIFDAQNKNEWRQANALIKRLHNKVLLGHVLYERYINAKDYKASYKELRSWMARYGDHPDAYKVYQLAQKRRNNNPDILPAPQMAKKLFGSLELKWLMKNNRPQLNLKKPGNRNESDVHALMRDIKSRLANERVTAAYNLLGSAKISRQLTAVEYDSLLGEIAAQYYYSRKYDAALKLARQAVKRSGLAVPVAHWTAGLVLWKKEDFKNAATHFESVTKSISRNPWMLSAGAFWAARAHQKAGEEALSNDWMQEAASYPRTFYGLIARNKLGNDDVYSWSAPPLTSALVSALQDVKSGRRALALLDIGKNNLAQKELMQTHPNGNQRLEKAMVAVAHHFNLPELALRLGNAVNQPDGKLYDVALYPVVPWKGDQSTGIDEALINALIRQESKFDANASNSRSGAKGLMQLMPSTAKFVSDKSFDARDLHKPEVNIALGQRYVRYLLKTNLVDGNLIYLAAAYNAGPGNLAKWQKKFGKNDDPFLFIESIPWSETRAFVERVMANYWIYSQRLSQENATLESLGNESWPQYKLPAKDLNLASSF